MKKLILSLSVLTLTVPSLLDATITIQTSDGQEIEFSGMQEQALLQAETIKNMADDLEEDDSIIPLPEISAATFENIMECLALLHQSTFLEGTDREEKEHALVTELDQLSAKQLIEFTQAVSYLYIPELLAVSSKVWNEKYALKYFKKNLPTFQNPEILDKLKANCLRSPQNFFINQYLKHRSIQSKVLKGHHEGVESVSFSPDGKKIASGSDDNTVRIWDATTKECLHTLVGHNNFVWSVCYCPDNTKITSGSSDNTIRIWDATAGECLHTLAGHNDWVLSVSFNPDGKKIVSGSNDNTVRIWDATTGKCLHTLAGHNKTVLSVCFSPDNTKIASGSLDNTVRTWDATTGEFLHTFVSNSCVWSVTFSPDSAKIVSASRDTMIRIWDARTGKCINILKDHKDDVNVICFSSDGTKMASGSGDKTIRIWDTRTGKCSNIFKDHKGRITSVSFNSDNTQIASGSEDKTIRVWDIVGPIKNLSLTSYEQILFHALCKETIEKNQTLDIKNKPHLFALFQTLPQENQELLYRTTKIKLPIKKKISLRFNSLFMKK